MTRFRLLSLATPLVLTAFAGSALAYVCHPAAPGVRSVTLRGTVQSVAVRGKVVDFVVARSHRCARVTWSTVSGRSLAGPAACAARTTESALHGIPVGVDASGRPVLRVGARDLPLPLFGRSAVAADGIALVAATHPDGGVLAVRLRDGAFTYLGPNGASFAPQISARGAVFHDGESKAALRAGKTVAMFVPRRAIEQGFAKTTAPLRTDGPIHGFSMDGLRVSLSVGDRARSCDSVLYWNVAWPPVQRISSRSGTTCDPGYGPTRIGAVSIGGFRAEWLAVSRLGARVIAGSPLCQEWVVRRLGRQHLAALAADGPTLAYATTAAGATDVGVVGANWRARTLAAGRGASVSLGADGPRVAALWPDGTLGVWNVEGTRLVRLHIGPGRAIALEGSRLAVLRRHRLDVYNLERRRRVASFSVDGATGLDLQYGVAAFARGRDAVVLDTRTGRESIVGRAPQRLVGVQIEGPGLAYAWTDAQRGVARFVPTIRLDEALGR